MGRRTGLEGRETRGRGRRLKSQGQITKLKLFQKKCIYRHLLLFIYKRYVDFNRVHSSRGICIGDAAAIGFISNQSLTFDIVDVLKKHYVLGSSKFWHTRNKLRIDSLKVSISIKKFKSAALYFYLFLLLLNRLYTIHIPS